MQRPDWAGESTDIERPSVARMYDYYLGGSHNFAVDREAARRVLAAAPEIPLVAQANRACLRRAVRFLVDAGVRQFLDIGSGIPTAGNVHEIAQRLDQQSRVVYVDIDPVAVAHSRQMLAGNDRAAAIQEDLRQPDRILDNPDLRELLDFDQPIAVMLLAVLHFIPDSDDPEGLLSTLRKALVPGSYLALSHGCAEGRDERTAPVESVYRQVQSSLHLRSRAAVARFFDGFELVDPGLVWGPEWRPEAPDHADHADRAGFVCGVGRLRG
jgi:SAM-dependent methyltransferase